MALDLNQVSTFVRVAQTGSFTAAAVRLGVPKSTVSRRVSSLEEALGVRLIQRTTRRVRLTEAGRGYFERVAASVDEVESASTRTSDLAQTPHGTLRVTAPADLGGALLAELISEFAELYPLVSVDVVLTSRLVDLVNEGIDIALRAGGAPSESLTARHLGSFELILVASPTYLAHRGRPDNPQGLGVHDCVLFRSRGGSMPLRLSDGSANVTTTATGRINSDDMTFVRAAALAGAGICLLPAFLANKHLADGSLERVLPRWRQRGALLSAVYPSAHHIPAKVRAFRDFLVSRLFDGAQLDDACQALP